MFGSKRINGTVRENHYADPRLSVGRKQDSQLLLNNSRINKRSKDIKFPTSLGIDPIKEFIAKGFQIK